MALRTALGSDGKCAPVATRTPDLQRDRKSLISPEPLGRKEMARDGAGDGDWGFQRTLGDFKTVSGGNIKMQEEKGTPGRARRRGNGKRGCVTRFPCPGGRRGDRPSDLIEGSPWGQGSAGQPGTCNSTWGACRRLSGRDPLTL